MHHEGFTLCRSCADRQGNAIQFHTASEEGGGGAACFICRGLASGLEGVAERARAVAKRYEFATFSVGLILPGDVQEREDQLRSEFKIKGLETVKSQFSRNISSVLSKRLRKRVDKLHPDLTLLIDLKDSSVHPASKSIFVHGRYTKPAGVLQKRAFCERCSGRGCADCQGTGYAQVTSVESVIAKRLGGLTRSDRMKFTWLGSEDESSVVYPPGRPFLVELKSPMRRKIPRSVSLRTGSGLVVVSGMKKLVNKPTRFPSFTFKVRAFIDSKQPLDQEGMRRLSREMKDTMVQFQNTKGRLVYKKVHSVRFLKKSGGDGGSNMESEIRLEGGLPVKRLVSGESVTPSFSEVLKTPVRCQRFDILRVWESGGFE